MVYKSSIQAFALILLLVFTGKVFAQEQNLDTDLCNMGGTGEAVYTDDSGDVELPYVDIIGVKVLLTEAELRINMRLKEIPQQVDYNEGDGHDHELKSQWLASFDVNCDGKQRGDVQVSIASFTFNEDFEDKGSVRILDETWPYLSLVSDDGKRFSSLGEATAQIENSILILTVKREDHPLLSTITAQTPVKFKTFFRDEESKRYIDYLPNGDRF